MPPPIPIQHVSDLHYEDLYRFAHSLAGQDADARDLTQHTMMIYASKGDSIREPERVKSWLFTTLRREFLRQRRKLSRFSPLSSQPNGGEEAVDPTASSAGDDTDSNAIMDALREMEDSLKAPLTLFYLQGMKYREIADILEVPIGTVMSRLARAKAALRTHFHVPLLPPPIV